jgi:hypothetical protein
MLPYSVTTNSWQKNRDVVSNNGKQMLILARDKDKQKIDVLKGGKIIIACLELEELSEEGKGLVSSSHGGSGS